MSEKFKDWLKHPISVAILPVFIAYGLGYLTPKSSPIKKLEYLSQSSNDYILSSNADKLDMKFNGKTINQLSKTDVQIFNRTGENYGDVELTFELQPDSSGKIPTLVNSPNLIGPDDYDNSKIQLKSKSYGKFTYFIHTINASSSWNDELYKYFKVSFVVIGKTAPMVKPKMAEKGLDITKYDTNPLTFTLFRNYLFGIVGFFIFHILISIFLKKRAEKRLVDQAVDKLRELSQGENASLRLEPTQIPDIVEIVLNPKRKNDTKDESRESMEGT